MKKKTINVYKMSKKMIKCCIFDLDGTLLNTLDTITYYVNLTLKNHNIEPISKDECCRFVGSGATNLIRRALKSRGIDDDVTVEKYLCEYKAAYDSNPYYLTESYPGIYELLAELKKQGVRLAVLSNKQHSAVVKAVSHFFTDVFDAVWGDTGDMPIKPSPEGIYRIIRDFGVDASECAYIGDSDVDAVTGINANVALNISVLWGFRTEDELKQAGGKTFVNQACEIFDLIN